MHLHRCTRRHINTRRLFFLQNVGSCSLCSSSASRRILVVEVREQMHIPNLAFALIHVDLSQRIFVDPPPPARPPQTHTHTHTEREREREREKQTDRHTDTKHLPLTYTVALTQTPAEQKYSFGLHVPRTSTASFLLFLFFSSC